MASVATQEESTVLAAATEDMMAVVHVAAAPISSLRGFGDRSAGGSSCKRGDGGKGRCQNTLPTWSKSPHLGGRRHAKTRGKMSEFSN